MKLFVFADEPLSSDSVPDLHGSNYKNLASAVAVPDEVGLKKWYFVHDYADISIASACGLLFVRRGEDIIPVKMADIAGVRTGDDVVVIHMRDGREILGDHTLKEYEGILNPLSFKRISRQWIINVNAIIKLSCSVLGTGHIYLEPDLDIVLSREKYTQFVKSLTD